MEIKVTTVSPVKALICCNLIILAVIALKMVLLLIMESVKFVILLARNAMELVLINVLAAKLD